MNKAKDTVLIIPDTQIPFDHPDAIPFLKTVRAKYKPTRVVQIGDFFDLHALSKYPSNPDGYSPGHEIEVALERASEYYSLFPKVDLVLGNHDLRVTKRAFEVGIPAHFLKTFSEWMQLPKGWKVHDLFLEIDGVAYQHGIGYSGKEGHRKAAERNMQSTVIGHLHAHAGISFMANREKLFFAFNVGALIDDHAYAFEYAKYNSSKSIIGCGVVDKGIPMFVPMSLNKQSRWVGKL